MKSLTLLIALAFLAAPTAAQLMSGDIGVTGFSSSQFSVIDTGGVTAYPVGTFGGSTTQAILWDPQLPNDFIIGGIGFIGRASITGPGMVTYNAFPTAFGQATQMSWGPTNDLVVMDQTTDQIVSWDEVTSTLTQVTTGSQPWGTSVNAGIYDPNTGNYYIGNNGSVYTYTPGAGANLFATGWHTSTSFVSGIVVEPGSLDVIVTALSVSRVLRISQSGVISASDVVPPASIASPNSIALDTVNSQFIIGGSGGSVYSVPFGSSLATPTLITSVTGQGSSASGVSVVGTSGPPPFALAANAYLDGSADFSLSNIPIGTTSGWTFASADTSAPVGMGWAFGINPDALTFLILNIAPFPQPGNLFHWLDGFPTLYPGVPFNFPAGTLTPLSGSSFDFLGLAQDSGLIIVGSTNVVRIVVP